MINEVVDSKLNHWYQKQLRNNPVFDDTRKQLKWQALCGSTPAKTVVGDKVYLVSNGEKATFTNVLHCSSVWACPHCTAREMANKGTDIACAIDALATWYNQYAVMITFTLPHWSFMSCKDSLTILNNTWRYFSRGGNKRGWSKYVRKDGSVRVKGQNPYGKFREELEIKNYVKIYEITYSSKNGWHPHIHALYWAPKENFDKIIDYEEMLCDRWWHCAKKSATDYWNEKMPDNPERVKALINTMFTEQAKRNNEHSAVYISRNNKNKPRVQKSSYYLAGWSGDKEIASSFKTAKKGHYSVIQLVQEAYKAHQDKDYELRDKFLKLFAEVSIATRGKRKVEYAARTGIRQIINKWKETHPEKNIFKKKFMDKEENYHLVAAFTDEQWRIISNHDDYIKPRLLELALQKNAKELIIQFLEQYYIKPLIIDDHPYFKKAA